MGSPDVSGSPPGYTPAQISGAYGFSSVASNGDGQTIAIVDSYNDPNIVGDLQHFDSWFNLPSPPSFQVVGQSGGAPPTVSNAGWAAEESLDVEWAHAMAPSAKIDLVEANSSSLADLMAGVQWAASSSGASVVSMSWGFLEQSQISQSQETAYDRTFQQSNVTFVAASGDYGEPEYPALSPNVVGVGGTTLTLNSGTYGSESTWNLSQGSVTTSSGGGPSIFEAQPFYQNGLILSSFRAAPDVSYNAGPSGSSTSQTGEWFSIYDSFDTLNEFGSSNPEEPIGGTSAGSPQWAALIALANQQRATNGLPALTGYNQTLPAIYAMPGSDLHDITTGSNQYGIPAGPGYDMVTGVGTPDAPGVIASLSEVGVSPSADMVSAVPGSPVPSYFVKDSSGNVYYYTVSANSSGLLAEFGGLVASGAISISAAPAASTTNDEPSVFVLNGANDVYEIEYNPSSGTWGGLGGLIAVGVDAISAAPAVSATNNYPSVFVLNGAKDVYAFVYVPSSGTWGSLGGLIAVGVNAISPAPATPATNNYPSVFVLNGAQDVYELVYNPSSGTWGGLGGLIADGVDAISAAPASSNNYPSVAVLNGAGNVYDFAYNANTGSWGAIYGPVPVLVVVLPSTTHTKKAHTVGSSGGIQTYAYDGAS